MSGNFGDAGDEPGYELVMPFVVCASRGGPYDDESFVAGYQAGAVSASLEAGPGRHEAVVAPGVVAQLDLLAMQHGYRVEPRVLSAELVAVVFMREAA